MGTRWATPPSVPSTTARSRPWVVGYPALREAELGEDGAMIAAGQVVDRHPPYGASPVDQDVVEGERRAVHAHSPGRVQTPARLVRGVHVAAADHGPKHRVVQGGV